MLRDVSSNELITVLMVIGLIIISVTKLLSPKRFNDFVFVIGNTKYLKIYSREQKLLDKFDALLFINLIVSSSIFAAIYLQFFINENIFNISMLVKIAVGIGVFVFVKLIVERLLGGLFEMDKPMGQYLFQKISFKNYLGVFLLPINGILVYAYPKSLILVNIMLVLLLIINLTGLLISFKTHQSIIKNNLFYFIVYICALEIAPYIILYKLFIV